MFYSPRWIFKRKYKINCLSFLKHKVKTESPSDILIFIADRMFIVRSSNNLTNATFSSFARSIFTKLLKCTKYCLDLCFDVHESPSIKDVKRNARGDNEVDCYFAFGRKQSLLSDFQALLQISEYKSQILRLFMKEYEDEIYSDITGEKVFYCSIDNECKRFYNQNDN